MTPCWILFILQLRSKKSNLKKFCQSLVTRCLQRDLVTNIFILKYVTILSTAFSFQLDPSFECCSSVKIYLERFNIFRAEGSS